MKFNKIDMLHWHRKETYLHFLNDIPCTYSMTVNIDITKFLAKTKERKIKFFPSILYAISKIVNNSNEFRMDLDENGHLGYYEISNPCYTIFHKKTETFTNIWTEYTDNFYTFLQNYTEDMNIYERDSRNSKPLIYKNNFNVSVLPWTSFTGFNLNLPKGYNHFPPIFTIGKYYTHENKILLPMAIQVNHAICDGFHLSRFVSRLQNFVDTFTGKDK